MHQRHSHGTTMYLLSKFATGLCSTPGHKGQLRALQALCVKIYKTDLLLMLWTRLSVLAFKKDVILSQRHSGRNGHITIVY